MRFEVGEMARLVVAMGPRTAKHVGDTVIVLKCGPRKGEIDFGRPNVIDCDYIIELPDGTDTLARDYQLQKLNPPEEPVEMTHHEEVEA